MSASVAGLPYAMQRMPVEASGDMGRHPGMNGLDEQLKVGDARVGKHAVTEIEDVTGAAAGAPQHVPRALADQIGRSQEHRGVEVALDCAGVADSPPALVQRHPPVQRYDVGPGLGDRLQDRKSVV